MFWKFTCNENPPPGIKVDHYLLDVLAVGDGNSGLFRPTLVVWTSKEDRLVVHAYIQSDPKDL